MYRFIPYMRAHIRAVAALALIAILASILIARSTHPPRVEPTPVQTARALRADVADASLFTGTLDPQREVDIAAKSGGLVTALYADVGSRVGAGASLAQLDASQARATAASLTQNIEAARATLSATDALYAQQIASAQSAGTDAQTATISVLTDAAILAKQIDETLGNLLSLRSGATVSNTSGIPEAELSARDGQAKITARAELSSFQTMDAAFQASFDASILGQNPAQSAVDTHVASASALLAHGKTALSAAYTALSATVSSASVSDASLAETKQAVAQLGSQAQSILSRLHDTSSGLDTLKKERDARIAEAQAQIVALQGQQRVNETVLQDGTITAPFPGIITEKFLERGAIVGPGTPVVHLVDDSRLKLTLGVPDQSAASFRVGDSATVLLENGASVSARVSKVNPSVDTASRKVQIELVIPNASHALTPGSYARVVFEKARSAQVAVPRGAVYTQYGTSYVFVLSEGAVHRRVVTLGAQSQDLIEITKGLAAGETIVTSGVSYLRDGDAARSDDTNASVE